MGNCHECFFFTRKPQGSRCALGVWCNVLANGCDKWKNKKSYKDELSKRLDTFVGLSLTPDLLAQIQEIAVNDTLIVFYHYFKNRGGRV